MHRQMRSAMQARNWGEAYQLWTEMQLARLNNPDAKLDAIHSLVELEKFAESVSLATNWLSENGDTADTKQIEELADKMINVQSADGQQIATTAFSLVADRLTRRSKLQDTK
jgi:hypothetical protein